MSEDQRLDEEKSFWVLTEILIRPVAAGRIKIQPTRELSASTLNQSGVIGTFNPPLSQVPSFCYWRAPVMVLIKVKV